MIIYPTFIIQEAYSFVDINGKIIILIQNNEIKYLSYDTIDGFKKMRLFSETKDSNNTTIIILNNKKLIIPYNNIDITYDNKLMKKIIINKNDTLYKQLEFYYYKNI